MTLPIRPFDGTEDLAALAPYLGLSMRQQLEVARHRQATGHFTRPVEFGRAAAEDMIALRATLRRIRDAIVRLFPVDPDAPCDDCGAHGDHPCAVHDSIEIWQTIRQIDAILGPCQCTHAADRHGDAQNYPGPCRECPCGGFTPWEVPV